MRNHVKYNHFGYVNERTDKAYACRLVRYDLTIAGLAGFIQLHPLPACLRIFRGGIKGGCYFCRVAAVFIYYPCDGVVAKQRDI